MMLYGLYAPLRQSPIRSFLASVVPATSRQIDAYQSRYCTFTTPAQVGKASQYSTTTTNTTSSNIDSSPHPIQSASDSGSSESDKDISNLGEYRMLQVLLRYRWDLLERMTDSIIMSRFHRQHTFQPVTLRDISQDCLRIC
jgi:hypothetical protein